MKFTAIYTPGVSYFHFKNGQQGWIRGQFANGCFIGICVTFVWWYMLPHICWYTCADTHVLIHICWYTCLLYVVPIETVEHNCTHFWMGYFMQKPLFLEDRKLRIPRNIHWIERVEISIERNIEYAKYRTLPPRMKAFLEMIVNHEKNDLIIIKFWLFSCIHNSVGRIWCKYFSGWIV